MRPGIKKARGERWRGGGSRGGYSRRIFDNLHIRNLRGIRSLDVTDLGRINLVLGNNEAGKTTFLAAAGFALGPQNWSFLAPYLADPRPLGFDFERHWVSLFPGNDPTLSPQVWMAMGRKRQGWRLEVTKTRAGFGLPIKVIADPGKGPVYSGEPDDDDEIAWTPEPAGEGAWWSPAFVEPESATLAALINLYKAGRIEEVVAPMRTVNPDILGVEVIGDGVFVRLVGHPLPLRFACLGDGARRLLEFALAITHSASRLVLIDELENGLHYRTLPVALSLLQSAPLTTQVFASTHQEEVIRTACELFIARKDSGLRIIRLDKGPTEHRVVVYTAEQALAGLDSGLELRG